MRILVDSSVWVAFFNAKADEETALDAAIESGDELCVCGHVLSEVLRGARQDSQFDRIERHFTMLQFLPMTERTFKDAAVMFRSLNRRGLTLKNSSDTYIASVAIEHGVHLLHNDRDFDLIAREFPLKTL